MDGDIENIELYSSCKYIYALKTIQWNDKKALNHIRQVEKLYNSLEYSAKLADVYDLYIQIYEKEKSIEKVKYYQNKKKTLLFLNKEYLN